MLSVDDRVTLKSMKSTLESTPGVVKRTSVSVHQRTSHAYLKYAGRFFGFSRDTLDREINLE